jgi:hypothetical protein
MGGQCSMCADATSAGLFPSMARDDPQLPSTGYAYLRIADQELRQEIAKWCGEAVEDGLLAPPGPPGSEECENRTSTDEMHVTIATGIAPAALEAMQALADRHCPFELQLEQLQIVQDEEGGDFVVCIGVADAPALVALRRDLAEVDGVSCGDTDTWHRRVVAARVHDDTNSDAKSDRIDELRKDVERNKRIFFQRSWEATQLVIVMPPDASQSSVSGGAQPQMTVFELAYKGGGI